MNVRTVVLMSGLLFAACAGPSAAQREQQAQVARLMMTASAVHMPPKPVDSCVGVTVRLTDPSGKNEPERMKTEVFISGDEAEAAVQAAGLERCRRSFLMGLEDGGIGLEPLALTVGYGVDPDGRVCAVVERQRADVIDPAAAPLVQQAAGCLKNTLFAAQFPKERVQDKERVVRLYTFHVQGDLPTTVTSSAAEAG